MSLTFSDKRQRSCFHAPNTHLCACEPGVYHIGKELQEQLAAPHFLRELREGEEVGKPSHASVFLCLKYYQPQENKTCKTCTLLYTTACGGKNRNTHTSPTSFTQGKIFSSKTSMQGYCRRRQALKKPQGKSREKQNQNVLSSPICDLSPFRGPRGHTCTTKTSTSHQKTKTACCTNIRTYPYMCAFTKAMLLCLQSKKKNTELNHTKNLIQSVCLRIFRYHFAFSGITSPFTSVITFVILNFHDGGIPCRFQLVAFTV